MTMFKAKNITKSFREDFWKKTFFALQDVSFEVNSGSITGFLGANGAGKTTFTKILLNFIKQDSGTIELLEKNSKINKVIGFLPERPYFYPHLTGRDLLYYFAELTATTKFECDKITKHWSEVLRIDHALDKRLKDYSKGMLQRIGFISAILHDPQLIVLDEPLSGLDPIGRKEFKDAILDLNKKGKTIFMSSHIISDIEEICSHVIVLDHGKVIQDGRLEDILNKNNESIKITTDIESINDAIKQQVVSYTKKGRYFEFEVKPEAKNDFLRYLIDNNYNIEKVISDTPSLEEVIYGLKQ